MDYSKVNFCSSAFYEYVVRDIFGDDLAIHSGTVLSELEMVETEAEASGVRERMSELRETLGRSSREVEQFRKEFDKLAYHNIGQWTQSAFTLASCLKSMLDISRETKNLRAKIDSPERIELQPRGAAPVPSRSLRSNRIVSQSSNAVVVDLSEKEDDAAAIVFTKSALEPLSKSSGNGMMRLIDSTLNTPDTRIARPRDSGLQDFRSNSSALGMQEAELRGKRPLASPEETKKLPDACANGHSNSSGENGKRVKVSPLAGNLHQTRSSNTPEIVPVSEVEFEDTGTETESNCGTIDLT